jgi:hemoglobin
MSQWGYILPISDMETLYQRLGGHEGIVRLLRPFYVDVRQHNLLGPIFNSRIDDWPAHLATIAEFWDRHTGGPSSYGGGFASAHLPLGIHSEHLAAWLGLWELNCRRHLAAPEADEMIELAHELGGHLMRIVTGRTGVQIGTD